MDAAISLGGLCLQAYAVILLVNLCVRVFADAATALVSARARVLLLQCLLACVFVCWYASAAIGVVGLCICAYDDAAMALASL